MAALAKLLAVCAGTVGGAAACVATGVVPTPLDPQPERAPAAKIERASPRTVDAYPEDQPTAPQPAPAPEPEPGPEPEPEPTTSEPAPEAIEAGAVEYAPPPERAPPPTESAAGSTGGPAGEFGP